MHHNRWWMAGVGAGLGALSLAATTGIVALASFFVADLTEPHKSFDENELAGILADAWAVPDPEPEPPLALQRPLVFHAADGPLLRGDFWAQPHPAPTVIICHGYRVSRAQLRPVAAIEYQYGCNVLFFDFRGHGESEGQMTSGGVAEVRDLRAAIALAVAQPETIAGQIIIHGFSMGAAVALLALPHPDVAAVIADSPYAQLDDILRRLINWRLTTESARWNPALRRLRPAFPGVAWVTVAASAMLFRVRWRQDLLAAPAAGMRHWRGTTSAALTPILLIHAAGDQMIPIEHAHRIAEAARLNGIPIETYFADEHVHCGSYGHDPARYLAVLQDFVARHLGITFRRVDQAA
jgi:uncharacterized protein